MDRKLIWKFVLIIGLIILCLLQIVPPSVKLKPGIDLAGGTSLLYQIDMTGLDPSQKRDIAQRMIRILRQRIDPSNKRNLVWRPHGADRIEIQMPLASEQTRALRKAYQQALNELQQHNIEMRLVRQALIRPAGESMAEYRTQRDKVFATLAGKSKQRLELLKKLGQAYDALMAGKARQAKVLQERKNAEAALEKAKVNVFVAKTLARDWDKLDDPNRMAKVNNLLAGIKAAKAKDSAKKAILNYMKVMHDYVAVVNEMTGPDGLQARENKALDEIESANINIERLRKYLAAPKRERTKQLNLLKAAHPEISSLLDKLVVAYDKYAKVAGRLDDPEDLKRQLRGSGVLEFRILPLLSDSNVISDGEIKRYRERLAKFGPKKASDNNYVWQKIKSPDNFKVRNAIIGTFAGDKYVLASNQPGECLLHERTRGGWQLTSARVGSDRLGNWAVNFNFNEIGAKRFLQLTKNNLNRPLCILLDGEAISAPNIQSAIRNSGQITGQFTLQEVRDLVDKLNAGSLPARLGDQPISVNTIGPTMGRDNLQAGLRAGVYGLIAVAAFMLLYYMVAGALADIALFMNLLLIIGVMAFSRSTFTMPGIAGLILTIGMAVDANVLIFERIREEQARGSSLRMAIKNGYSRAFRTILDSNATTFIVGLILWMLASEEVKGFALTLMIGIISSMFTALFVTRTIFDFLTGAKILKNKLVMLQIIKNARVKWMKLRPVFLTISLTFVLGGWVVFLSVKNKYSIEFTGGTSIHVILNKAGKDMTRADVEKAVINEGIKSHDRLLATTTHVQRVGTPDRHEFEITTAATNIIDISVKFPTGNKKYTAKQLQDKIRKAAAELGDRRMGQLIVKAQSQPDTFLMETTQTNRNIIDRVLKRAGIIPQATVSMTTNEIVSNAVRNALAGKLDVLNNLHPVDIKAVPIDDKLLSEKPYLSEFSGGVLVSCKLGDGNKETLSRLRKRFSELRFKAGFEKYGNNKFKLFIPGNKDVGNKPVNQVEMAVVSSDTVYGASTPEEWQKFVANEKQLFKNGLELQSSFSQNTQIDPSVGQESMTSAIIAMVFSLLAIIVYVWLRFGNVRFGMAAVVALIHDVSIAMGLVAASSWLSTTAIGKALLIGDFKIDLPMIAGFLTVIGYSLNDTIVVFDRIRENRGKMATLSLDVIDNSINQTLSRTILTSATTLMVLFVMYIWGSPGLRGFNFVLIVGVIVGTYSSIAIASPLLYGIGGKVGADGHGKTAGKNANNKK